MESRPEFESAWDDLTNKVADDLGQPGDDPVPTPKDVANALIEEWGQETGAMWIALLDDTRPRMAAFLHVLQMSIKEASGREKTGMRFLGGLKGAIFGVGGPFHKDEGPPDEAMLGGFLAMAIPLSDFAPDTETLIAGFRAVQMIWESIDPADLGGLEHPLAALIESWLNERPVAPDERATAIMPATLARVRDMVDAPTVLFDLADYEQATGFASRPELQGHLPGLAPERSELIAPLPLLMWDASSEGAPRRGKGAPLALRTWVEAVLSLPVDKRGAGRVVEIQWRDFTNWLMPNGRYQRSDFQAIMRALHSVHNLRLPWDHNGISGLWAAVQVRTFPRAWNAYDAPVRFEVELPPGVNDRGPLVYRPALRELGQQAALRYRAYLGLCYLWDRYGARGGRYIQPTRPRLFRDSEDRILNAKGEIITGRDGQPVRRWTVGGRVGQRKARPGIVPLDVAGNPVALANAAQERNPAADRYPILSPAQLMELCYSPARERLTRGTERRRKFEASKAIKQMAAAGYCLVEDLDDGLRILPQQGWGAFYGG